MSTFNLNTLHVDMIRIFEDVHHMRVIKKIVETKDSKEEAFYIADIGDIIKKHEEWISKMPRIIPYYAIKCNTVVIKILVTLNAHFSCMSKEEIAQVMLYHVPGERIIFANPIKSTFDIKYAKDNGVELMIVDNKTEIQKIKDFFPEAKIVLRIRCETENSQDVKFGCNRKEAKFLLRFMRHFGLNLHGFSFYVETPHLDMEAYLRGIKICKQLIPIAKKYGHNVQLINIGGGFPSNRQEFSELADLINGAIEDLDSHIKVISEPGRYLVESSFTLVSNVRSMKIVISEKDTDITKKMYYYISCGLYNLFLNQLPGMQIRIPEILFQKDNKKFLSTIWESSTDCFDLILKDVLLPELHLDSWLVWRNMGAYALVSSTFNGLPIPMKQFIRKKEWENFQIKLMKDVSCSEEEIQNQ